MRKIYLDESGSSTNDSTFVVAGAIINADEQFVLIETYLNDLIETYVPRERQPGFIFHAKDLFHGTGRTDTDRRVFPLEKSHEILKKLLAIPSTFGIPIVYSYLRNSARQQKKSTQAIRHSMMISHAVAYSLCVVAAEGFLRSNTPEREVAEVLAEDNTQTKKAVTRMHDILRGHWAYKDELVEWSETLRLTEAFLPLRKIKEGVYFANKYHSPLLQIADACALIVRYFVEQKPNTEAFVDAFRAEHPWELHRGEGGYNLLRFSPRS